jgi:hypothetical protein
VVKPIRLFFTRRPPLDASRRIPALAAREITLRCATSAPPISLSGAPFTRIATSANPGVLTGAEAPVPKPLPADETAALAVIFTASLVNP